MFDLFSPKLGHVTRRAWWIYMPVWKFINVFVSKIWGHKLQI